MTPIFLSLEHAAEYADVSVKTVKRWIERGLPKYQAGSRSKVLIRTTDIEDYLRRQQAKTPNLDALVDEVVNELMPLKNS